MDELHRHDLKLKKLAEKHTICMVPIIYKVQNQSKQISSAEVRRVVPFGDSWEGPREVSGVLTTFFSWPKWCLHKCVHFMFIKWTVYHPDLCLFLFLFFFFLRAEPRVYGSSQARGWIGAVARDLRHSHSNSRPLTQVRDWTDILMDSSWVHYCWAMWKLLCFFLNVVI